MTYSTWHSFENGSAIQCGAHYLSICFGNASYRVLIKSTPGAFEPASGNGNTPIAVAASPVFGAVCDTGKHAGDGSVAPLAEAEYLQAQFDIERQDHAVNARGVVHRHDADGES
ncbi:hypothetical protein E1N52_21350 [Paraburkholderia guartelaensis]|uniref:Uncharacterized protein n=1 Tax=Paraburkholderia guartelaensis TaxID=2546446 RepID=A0A4R5LAE0_9BURK|nr:hypothetical protein [Paraburkholderia guartelaensis]TDG06110.1 hypothetical protein E1N52_21350 [Paraburkholderia guartelaensis]